jgi:hypothetical protein
MAAILPAAVHCKGALYAISDVARNVIGRSRRGRS